MAVDLSNKLIKIIDLWKTAKDVLLFLIEDIPRVKAYLTQKLFGINLYSYLIKAY